MIELLAANWLWIAVIALFVLMHRGGHGCGMHGGHGDHASHGHGHQPTDQDRPADRAGSDHGGPHDRSPAAHDRRAEP